MSIEAMKQALEALECLFGIPEQFTGKGGGDVAVWTLGGSYRAQQAIPVLRRAIEQAEKNQFNPDWDAMAVMVEEQQRMAKRIQELEQAEKQEPVAYITPLMEQQMFDDWCPYKGSPDPRIVWAAAVEAVNGLLLGAAPPAAPVHEMAAEKQEPVAWMDGYRNIYSLEEKTAGCEDAVIPLVPAIQHWSDCAVHNEPAYPKGDCDCGGYTAPPAAHRQWVGLTDEERAAVFGEFGLALLPVRKVIAEELEAKLREKNGGKI